MIQPYRACGEKRAADHIKVWHVSKSVAFLRVLEYEEKRIA